ncbi:hyaluronan synthase 2-like [Branchiostoma floridae]|uniref:Hyaluronan synthase 2-like n=2 Tax=Branchiostoma floridae TaxID=7739 RepID=A0A9J7M590_BRAFL|nr:hyaluronan synthase 2-like [Branchiostoma floridae]
MHAKSTTSRPAQEPAPERKKMKCRKVLRIVFTTLFAVALFAGMVAVYAWGFQFLHNNDRYISFGLYGAIVALHLIIQSIFAYLEHRVMKRADDFPPCQNKSVALMIAAYQEDPILLQKCLESIRDIQYENLKVVLVIDGNSDDDMYMRDQFVDVFGAENSDTFVWRHNFHAKEKLPEYVPQLLQDGTKHLQKVVVSSQKDTGEQTVQDVIRNNKYSCIMQKWGGKREVMYTAFKALGNTVDYIQVCDSDTILDPKCTTVMAQVLDNDRSLGAVGGDVRIWNHSDSVISFMSSLRYWMAFNIERACQSYFNVVSCISGPLGFYRNDLLQSILEKWYNQKFLGKHCTFGDDRHLTNRILSLGYGTKYTARSFCYTETPAQYLRWLNQQTRWTKSYFREWLYNAKWFHKHHLWMTYESIITGLFPFFVTITVIRLFYVGVWNIVLILVTIQLVGLVKSIYACILRKNPIMIFMSVYSMLYMTSLLPTKYWAILTINKSGWGTSGRKKIVTNFIPLVPLIAWFLILAGGIAFSIYREVQIQVPQINQLRLTYIGVGLGVYLLYWLFIALLFMVRKCRAKTFKDGYDLEAQGYDNQTYKQDDDTGGKKIPPPLDLSALSTRRPTLIAASPDYESGILTGVPQFVYPDRRRSSQNRRTSIERWGTKLEDIVEPKSPRSPKASSPTKLPTLAEGDNRRLSLLTVSPNYEKGVLSGVPQFVYPGGRKASLTRKDSQEQRWHLSPPAKPLSTVDEVSGRSSPVSTVPASDTNIPPTLPQMPAVTKASSPVKLDNIPVTKIPGRPRLTHPTIKHGDDYVEHGYNFSKLSK